MALQSCEKELSYLSLEYKGELLLRIIDISNELGERKKQQIYLDELYNLPSYKSTSLFQFKWNSWSGILNYHYNNIEEAEKYFHEELSIAILSNNIKWQAKSYNDLGIIAEEKRDFNLALKHYLHSIELFKKIKNNFKVGIGYHNIGLIYSLLEDYDNAKEYINYALAFYQKHQENDIVNSKILNQIVHVHESLLQISLKLNDLESAHKYSSLIMTSKSPNITNLDHSVFDLVKLYIAQEQYDLAAYFLTKASKVLSENNNFNSELYYLSALLNQKINKTGIAIDYLNKGLKIIKTDNFLELSRYYLLLSELFEINDKEKSIQYLKKHNEQREYLLEKKYNSSLKAIQFSMEKEKIENDLINEKLKSVTANLEIKTLNNKILVYSIVSVLLFFMLLGFYLIKRQEQKKLIDKINSHKKQLLLLSIKSDEENLQINVENRKNDFKKCLVKTMNNAVMIWEKHTRTNRIELADQSKIWTISIDDGNLRTRSLDKYLSIKKIPKNPRWRNVVRTCHFVLSDPTLEKNNRKKLENNLSNLILLSQKI